MVVGAGLVVETAGLRSVPCHFGLFLHLSKVPKLSLEDRDGVLDDPDQAGVLLLGLSKSLVCGVCLSSRPG